MTYDKLSVSLCFLYKGKSQYKMNEEQPAVGSERHTKLNRGTGGSSSLKSVRSTNVAQS